MKSLVVERLQIATHSVNADMCTMMSNNYGEVEIRQDQYFFEWGGSSSQPLTVGCSQSKSWTKKSLYCLLVKSRALFTPFNIRIYVFNFCISLHFYWHITVYPNTTETSTHQIVYYLFKISSGYILVPVQIQYDQQYRNLPFSILSHCGNFKKSMEYWLDCHVID